MRAPRMNALFLSFSVALAYAAQYSLTSAEEDVGWAWWLFGAAAIGAAVTGRLATNPIAAGESPVTTRSWRSAVALILLALVLNGVALQQVVPPGNDRLAFCLWLASLAAAAAAARAWDGKRSALPSLPWTPLERAMLLAILAVALALRLPDLTTIPPEVHGDEAACGIAARDILRGGTTNLFALGWSNLSNIGFAISAASMAVFGDDLFGLRMASVLLGTATVLVTYLLARRLFSAEVACVAAFLLAVGHWPIHFSRSGIDYMQATFSTVLLLLLVHRGLQSRRLLDHLLAGFVAGLCFSVYYGARAAPVIVALFVLHRMVLERGFLRRHAAGLAAIALGAMIFFAPQLALYAREPGTFLTRTQAVWIFAPHNVRHQLGAYGVDSVAEMMRIQVERSLQAFNRLGETSLQYRHPRPLLDFWTGPLFVLGLAMATARPLAPQYFLLASWFWLILILGSILTVDALFSPRVVGLIPALFICAALPVAAVLRSAEVVLGKAGRYAAHILVALLLGLAFRANVHEYFVVHVEEHQPADFHTVLAAHVRRLNDAYRAYFFSRAESSLHYDTGLFLLPDVDGDDVRARPLVFPLEAVPETKGALFIVESAWAGASQRVATIRRTYPAARIRLIRAANGTPLFHRILVSRTELLAAREQRARSSP